MFFIYLLQLKRRIGDHAKIGRTEKENRYKLDFQVTPNVPKF